MKIIAKQIIASFLLLVMLVSTTGFSVFSHICLMNGNKTTQVAEPVSSCCAATEKHEDEKAPIEIKNVECCVNDITYIKFNFDALRGNAQHPELFFVALDYPVLTFLDFANETFVADNKHAQNLPPPKPGRDILLQSDLLRI